jgi:hypothetical protein
MLYNDSNFKSSAHIPDTPHENLILAEMILNNSSLQLINNGKHTDTCLNIMTEISKNSSAKIKFSCGVSGICADDLKLLSLYNIRISFLQCFNSVLLLPKKKKNRTLAKSDLENLFFMLLILAFIQDCSPYMCIISCFMPSFVLNLTSQVSILSLFSNNEDKEKNMRSILRNKCSKDGFIVYEKDVVITKLGMKQLIIHMYGLQSWIKAKINNMKNKFSKSDLARVRFFLSSLFENRDKMET